MSLYVFGIKEDNASNHYRSLYATIVKTFLTTSGIHLLSLTAPFHLYKINILILAIV